MPLPLCPLTKGLFACAALDWILGSSFQSVQRYTSRQVLFPAAKDSRSSRNRPGHEYLPTLHKLRWQGPVASAYDNNVKAH